MLSKSDPNRVPTYRRILELAQKSFELRDPRVSRVEIPYQGTTLPAYFSAAPATDQGPAPVMIMFNGLDSTKEHMYNSEHWAELAARGISTLMVDPPGSGEALRLQGLTSRVDSEAWATACVDYLETRDDVDPTRIGLVGWSLGGYYAPRAAAFEKRLALVVAWGANHNWGAVQRRRLQREGERPVPHYWEHVLWVWGFPDDTDLNEFVDFADQVHLDGVVEQIDIPFLICHGENDRQIPLEYAHRSYDQAVNSPKRELRIFTPEEGGTEHIGLDHLPLRQHLHRRLGRRHPDRHAPQPLIPEPACLDHAEPGPVTQHHCRPRRTRRGSMAPSIPTTDREPTAEAVTAARVTGFILTASDRTGLALSSLRRRCGPTPPKTSTGFWSAVAESFRHPLAHQPPASVLDDTDDARRSTGSRTPP